MKVASRFLKSLGYAVQITPLENTLMQERVSGFSTVAKNGPPSLVIVLRSDGSGDRAHFQSVEAAGRVEHPYSRRDEWFTIWLCRGLKVNLQTVWPRLKTYN